MRGDIRSVVQRIQFCSDLSHLLRRDITRHFEDFVDSHFGEPGHDRRVSAIQVRPWMAAVLPG